jgi:hypothetical protein
MRQVILAGLIILMSLGAISCGGGGASPPPAAGASGWDHVNWDQGTWQ